MPKLEMKYNKVKQLRSWHKMFCRCTISKRFLSSYYENLHRKRVCQYVHLDARALRSCQTSPAPGSHVGLFAAVSLNDGEESCSGI